MRAEVITKNARGELIMFVYSVKSAKLKKIGLAVIIVVAVAALIYFTADNKPTARDGAVSLKAGSADERLAFLSQFGWEVEEEPVEVSEVMIPAEFDEDYEKYNEIQKGQNHDLSTYKGKRVKRWTYAVKNYPGYESRSDVIQANLLVYNGMVIGGDICSLELNGFLSGFDFPEVNTPGTQGSTSPSLTAAE